jgi:hypothetical protein
MRLNRVYSDENDESHIANFDVVFHDSGEILLMEDTTDKAHRILNVERKNRHSIFIMLEPEQGAER